MKRSERNKIKGRPEIITPTPTENEATQQLIPTKAATVPSVPESLKENSDSKSQTNEDKQPQRKKNTEEQKSPLSLAAKFVKSHRLILELLGLPLAFLSIAGFWLSYVPKISVSASESVSLNSPMGTMFDLSNDGALEIHEVVASVANLHLENNGPRGFQVLGMGEFTNVPSEARADVLSPGHKMGLPYAPAFGFTGITNFTGGSLTIIVRYRPAWLPCRKTEVFPFRAVRTESGGWVWRGVAN